MLIDVNGKSKARAVPKSLCANTDPCNALPYTCNPLHTDLNPPQIGPVHGASGTGADGMSGESKTTCNMPHIMCKLLQLLVFPMHHPANVVPR